MGEGVRQRYLSVTQPRFLLTDAVFKLGSSYTAWIMAYFGLPLIGGIVDVSKLLTSLLTGVAAMVGGGRTD